MKKRQTWSKTVVFTTAVLLVAMLGCGRQESLESVDPDFDDPAWYDDYKNSKREAYDKYDDSVVQIGVLVSDKDESTGTLEVTGTTGHANLYRASCKFPRGVGESLKDVRPGSFIRVKGEFDHMQETSNSYQIYLRNCVVVR